MNLQYRRAVHARVNLGIIQVYLFYVERLGEIIKKFIEVTLRPVQN